MNSIIAYDKALFLFLNQLGNETWDGFWLVLTHKLTAVPLYLFLAYLTLKKEGIKTMIIVVLLVSIMVLATDQLTNTVKYGLERLRPCHDKTISSAMRLVKSHCGGKYGFFSAHATNTMAVATFFSLFLGKYVKGLSLWILLWAVLVAYSRVYIGVHYPLDILAGMGVGAGMGWLFHTIKNKIAELV